MTLETCDESDEETWPDQPKDYDKDKDNDKDKPNDKNISRTLAKSAFETFDQRGYDQTYKKDNDDDN